jgi:hypothetical protein
MNSKIQILIVALISNVIVVAQENIMISDVNSPSEPSIVMNPNNTNELVAGANINSVYNSNDGGKTWKRNTLTSTYGVWGDPTIITDDSNNFYFFHLSNPSASVGDYLDRIVCQKKSSTGSTWSNGSFMGLNGSKDQDKQWAVFDKKSKNIYATWTQFDKYGSKNVNDKTNILFSKSTDQGVTWSPAVKINNNDGNCIDSSDTVEGAVPTVGSAGEIYVSWSGPKGLVFKKSLDQGARWSANEITLQVTNKWDFSIPGVSRCNGLPITSCDLSNSPNKGTIYVNWSNQGNGANDTDVFISKSKDGGATWSKPKRVNDDGPGKQQFLSWMTIDQTNGDIHIVFYDRRNYTDNKTDVYLATSTDGGETFVNKKISKSPFTPTSSVFFGDYTNITAHNGQIRPIWSRMENGNTSIWTALISKSSLSNPEFDIENNQNDVASYPNPAVNQESYFSFKLYKESNVSIKIYDTLGKEVYNVVNKAYPMGKHVLSIKSSVLQKGEYLYVIKTDYYEKSKKMIID